jgi:para-aminobenzoate synthetase/4-amino-4-deoxychorismate lyase
MNLIADLEESPREVYCGAIGFAAPGDEVVFNVPIRTVVIDTEVGTAEYGVGGGITWDSTVEGEYSEALTKAKLLTESLPHFELLESLKLDHGEYFLLERHLQRLKQSAEYFNFNISSKKIDEELKTYAQNNSEDIRKVRLLVSKEGKITVNGEPITALHGSLPVDIAKTPVSKNNCFLYHKTTHRKVYERHQHRAEKPIDAFDVLLWNEEGELTEFTNGNLVLELHGQLWTPPRKDGLLAGTLREELLSSGQIKERSLTRDDLNLCTALWLINSVRGWVPVYVMSEESALV